MVARRHHYVPKCYLKNFAVDKAGKKNRNLLVFDAENRKCFRTAPDNVALEKDFNTIDIEGHEPDAFEKAMASVESEIGPAITRIIEKESLADEDDRAFLLNLIGLLHIRNPRFREIRRLTQDHLQKMIMDLALSSKGMWDSQIKQAKAAGAIAQDADTDYESIKKTYRPEEYTAVVPNEANIVTEMGAFDKSLPLLFERSWVLVKAPNGSSGFVTCDHPVTLMWSDTPRHRLPLGLRMKGTEIFFPISPRLAVVGAYELENGEVNFTEEQVASSNGTTILNAQRQVYSLGYDFKYQIDQKKDPRTGTSLIGDELFRGTLPESPKLTVA